jgi:hypothetical protein
MKRDETLPNGIFLSQLNNYRDEISSGDDTDPGLVGSTNLAANKENKKEYKGASSSEGDISGRMN